MKKVLLYIVATIILALNPAQAFLTGSAPGSTPWLAPVPGAVYVSFNVVTLGNFQQINVQPSVDVTTLRIGQVLVSDNYPARGSTVTISYDVTNTSTGNMVNSINPTLNFYYLTTGNIIGNNYFTVNRISPAPGNYSLAGGATTTNVFLVTIGATRPTGNFIVDGLINTTAGTNDYFWSNALIQGSSVQTAAITPNFLREAPSTLGVTAITVTSPNGAIDTIVSLGQNFVVSFNIYNLGESDLNGSKQVVIDFQGNQTTFNGFVIGQPITINLTANALSANSLVTVSIFQTSVTDSVTGLAPGWINNGVATLSITVENPASLNIISITTLPVTAEVTAYQNGPVTVNVRVQNIGSANAIINVVASNLQFMTSLIDQSGTYLFSIPSASMFITSNQIVTVSYVITKFGGGVGICTVNATLNAIDQNSGWATSSSNANAFVTYNVTYNAGIVVGAISTNVTLVGNLGTFLVYVPISGVKAGQTINVVPSLGDLIISINGIDVSALSLNVSAVIPPNFQLVGVQTRMVTYTATFLASAVSGAYTIDMKPNFPVATNNVGGMVESSPLGALATASVTYDPISPTLILATPNINNIPFRLTGTTNNFFLTLEFSETMNATFLPTIGFQIGLPGPSVTTGSWNSPTNSIFTSNTMNLTVANAGWVTANLTGGAKDIAGNTVATSMSFVAFYVDIVTPSGAITINNGDALTINSQVTLSVFVSDDFSSAVSMDMWIFGYSTSDVATPAAGITVNQWIPYQQVVTLNLDTSSFVTKSIFIRFRDQAGNISSTVSDSIFLDTNSIVWNSPTGNDIVSNNFWLRTATSILADSVSFYVSVNNTLTLISSDVKVNGISTVNYFFSTANLYPGTTANAELVAVVSKNSTWVTASITNITFDNTAPDLTYSFPPEYAYVSGVVTFSGTATDNNLLTQVTTVQISVQTGAASYVAAVGTGNWTYAWTVPAVADFTTYNVIIRAYDQVGNVTTSITYHVVKYSTVPSINVLVPTAGIFVRSVFPISGNATCPLTINNMLLTFDVPAVNSTPNLTYVSGWNYNWLGGVTISSLTSGTVFTVTINAFTQTTPSLVATRTVQYTLDETTPSMIAINIPTNGAVGTLNITGNLFDISGISALMVSVDAGPYVALTYNATATNGTFSYVLPIGVSDHAISFRVSDNSWPTNNSYTFTYVITFNAALYPTGGFVTPVSGSYVNNIMPMTVTAQANDGGTVSNVWVTFTSNLGSSTVTANFAGGMNWNLNWTVPATDPHGTTYNAVLQVLSSTGLLADVITPSVQAVYTKDIFGPGSVFLNIANGAYLDPSSSPAPIRMGTYTLGALVSECYLIVDNVTYNSATRITPLASSTNWQSNLDYITLPGSVHTLMINARDTAGNWVTSNTITIRTIPSRIVTEPLPQPNGMIDGSTILTNPIYATSLNYVWFMNMATANIAQVYIDGVSGVVSINGSLVFITMNVTTAAMQERAYVIVLVESDGINVTPHYQPVVFDRTAPTINVTFSGVQRYYPNGFIAPNEFFMVNLLDRTASGNYGAGFSGVSIPYYFVTDNVASLNPGVIQRSVFNGGTTVNNAISGDTYDPMTELYRFSVNLNGGRYDLSLDAVDNAGNRVVATFNVYSLIVDGSANGRSGGIDTDQFITAYPNPYDPESGDVKFTYYLKDNAIKTRIFIYNEIGQLLHVVTIETPAVNGTQAGYNEVAWDARDIFNRLLSNGIYLYVIAVEGDKEQTVAKGKLAVLRR